MHRLGKTLLRHGSPQVGWRVERFTAGIEVVMDLLRINPPPVQVRQVALHGHRERRLQALSRCGVRRGFELVDGLQQRLGVVVLRLQAMGGCGGKEFDRLAGLRVQSSAVGPKRRVGGHGTASAQAPGEGRSACES